MNRPIRVGVVLMMMAIACSSTEHGADTTASVLRIEEAMCGRTMVATAVVVDDGLVLTNAHNVAGSDGTLLVRRAGGPIMDGVVVALDIERDLALLTVVELPVAPIPRGDPDEGVSGVIVRLDDDLRPTAIAYAGADSITVAGHDIYDAPSDLARASVRVLANVGPGWSGAPVLDDAGMMVGLVYAESRTTGFTYAVASAEIDQFLATAGTEPVGTTGPCAP